MSSTQNATAKIVLTKEEKLAAITAQIAKLQVRFDDVTNDREPTKTVKAAGYAPVVGDKVIAKLIPGTVTAIKPATIVEGKVVGATQVRVRINEGEFDEQLVTLYPAQLVKFVEPVAAEEVAAE
jgi:hypothetical protein